MDFAVLVDHKVKIKENKKRQTLKLCQRTKKVMENESDCNTTDNWYTQNGFQRLGKMVGRAGYQRMNQDNSNYSMIKIDQNTEKSSGDLRRLAVT